MPSSIRAPSIWIWSTVSRRVVFWTGSWGTSSARFCGRRWRAVCLPDVCSLPPPVSLLTEKMRFVLLYRKNILRLNWHWKIRMEKCCMHVSGGIKTGRLHSKKKHRRIKCCKVSRTRTSPCPVWKRRWSKSIPRRLLSLLPYNRKRPKNWAFNRSALWRLRRNYTRGSIWGKKTAVYKVWLPICVPTLCVFPKKHRRRQRRWFFPSTGNNIIPRNRVCTKQKAMRRMPMRPYVLQIWNFHPNRSKNIFPRSSINCIAWFGTALSQVRWQVRS